MINMPHLWNVSLRENSEKRRKLTCSIMMLRGFCKETSEHNVATINLHLDRVAGRIQKLDFVVKIFADLFGWRPKDRCIFWIIVDTLRLKGRPEIKFTCSERKSHFEPPSFKNERLGFDPRSATVNLKTKNDRNFRALS